MLSARAHGDVVRFRMGPKTLLFAFAEGHIRHVLIDRADNYVKGIGLEQARPVLGDGLLTSEGHAWASQRRLVEPWFEHQHVVDHRKTIDLATNALVGRWLEKVTLAKVTGHPCVVDLGAEVRTLALDILCRSVLGLQSSRAVEGIGAPLTIVLEEAMRRMLLPLPWNRFPTRRQRVFKRALSELDSLVEKLVRERMRMPDTGTDLFAALLARHRHSISIKPLRDELLTLLVAGHETTGVALVWTLYLTATHPDIASRLENPHESDEADRNGTLARNVIKEALRLYPPVWLIPRRALEEDRLGDYRVPAKTDVLISPYAIHRDAALWPEPHSFRPDRFANSEPYGGLRYLPFGLGPRRCVGASFALNEVEIALLAIMKTFRLKPLKQTPATPNALLTLRPPEPFHFLIEPRRST